MAGAFSGITKALFDEAKHKRGQGGKFASKGGAKPAGKKAGGSVATAHELFDKMKGKPKADVMAAAKAIGINPNTAKTQFYHWQKAQAKAALGANAAPTKAELKSAAAAALGVKPSAKPAQTPAPKPTPAPSPTPVTGKPPVLADLGPTKYVHALADHMKGASKKQVVDAAVAAGVNKSTAGVQYGKWSAKQAGEKPQLAKSPEPKALQAKQPDKMSDAELDKAIESYQGKLKYEADSVKYAPKPYNSKHDYQPYEGGKALTSKMEPYDIYTHPTQGKTFYKDGYGGVYEHTGAAGPMTKLSGSGTTEFHYDPTTGLLYHKSASGVLKPALPKKPIFKSQQPPPGFNDHAFKDHAWAGSNGVQNPDSAGVNDAVLQAHKNAGVTYNSTSSAVESYTGAGYDAINKALRSSKGEKVGSRAAEIDDLIAKSSFKQETVMWRGVGDGGTVWNGAPPPAEVIDHGFTSVSFRPDVGKRFSDGKTLFRVRVPAGFPGLNVAIGQPPTGVAGLEGEAEVMLPRGTTYRVVQRHPAATKSGKYGSGTSMDVVDLEPVLPAWYVKKYGAPKAA